MFLKRLRMTLDMIKFEHSVFALPFALTNSQVTALRDIEADMAAPHRMLRLLQGDVGSGKTVVAFAALVLARPAPALRPSSVPVEFDPKGPFLQYWHALKEGRPWPNAIAAGRGRAEDDASDLVVSSTRRAMRC